MSSVLRPDTKKYGKKGPWLFVVGGAFQFSGLFGLVRIKTRSLTHQYVF
jgi:hypothetical protein